MLSWYLRGLMSTKYSTEQHGYPLDLRASVRDESLDLSRGEISIRAYNIVEKSSAHFGLLMN
jgi:hypothetical protein